MSSGNSLWDTDLVDRSVSFFYFQGKHMENPKRIRVVFTAKFETIIDVPEDCDITSLIENNTGDKHAVFSVVN